MGGGKREDQKKRGDYRRRIWALAWLESKAAFASTPQGWTVRVLTPIVSGGIVAFVTTGGWDASRIGAVAAGAVGGPVVVLLVLLVWNSISAAKTLDRQWAEKLADAKEARDKERAELSAEVERAKCREERWQRIGAELLSVSVGARPRALPGGEGLYPEKVAPALNRAFGRNLDAPTQAVECFRFLRALGITTVESFEELLRDKMLHRTVEELLSQTGQGEMGPIELCTWGARLHIAPLDERPAVEEEIRAALFRIA